MWGQRDWVHEASKAVSKHQPVPGSGAIRTLIGGTQDEISLSDQVGYSEEQLFANSTHFQR